jgi:predicted permease
MNNQASFGSTGQRLDSKTGKREARGRNWLEILAQDVRVSLRVLRKSPGFTVVAVGTLALAIGANALVFAVMNALVLRPLPVPHAASLYAVERQDESMMAYPNYVDVRDRNRSFDGLAAFTMFGSVLDKGNDAAQAFAAETSANYFDVLEIRPYLGRFFHAADDHGPNSMPEIVLSYSYWHSRFQGDRGVIGRTVLVNKHPLTVIGVAPPDFHGAILFFGPDYFVPLIDAPEVNGWDGLTDRGNRWVLQALGHLKAGVTPAQAVADLNGIGAYLEKTYPKEVGHKSFALTRPGLAGSFLGKPLGEFMAGLMVLAGLILLAACANLGSLFAARAADRAREVALRLALGSSRKRILRQLLTEAMLLGVAGGAVGLAGSMVLLHQLAMWQPFPSFPLHVPATPDVKVYVVALALAVMSGVLFGMVPARQVMKSDPYEIVKAGANARLGRRVTLRDVLLVVQIALCGVLVTSSLVAVRGLERSLHADYGFEPKGAMLGAIDMSAAGYKDEQVPAMQKRMIDAMETIPGVERAATINQAPLAMGNERKNVFREQTADLQASHAVAMPFTYPASPGYFEASRTTLLTGRAFTWHDDLNAPRVAVVNREMARILFGSPDKAVGQRFRTEDGTLVEVVGVVENGKYFSLTEPLAPAVFLPNQQKPWGETTLVVRAQRDPAELAVAMRQKLRELDPGMAVTLRTWTDLLSFALFPSRMATVSLGVLGLMGALLSVTGIFGMAAYSVSKRLRELGIRMALGAQRREVLGTALGRALTLLGIGSAAGLGLGVLASRVLAFVVYEATPRDPIVLAGVVAAMTLLGLVATWIPAQRALGLDPLVLLREE